MCIINICIIYDSLINTLLVMISVTTWKKYDTNLEGHLASQLFELTKDSNFCPSSQECTDIEYICVCSVSLRMGNLSEESKLDLFSITQGQPLCIAEGRE